jgi:hypothetical protein
VLVRPDDGRIQIVLLPIELAASFCLLLERLKDSLPDTGLSPTVEACGSRLSGAVFVGQVPPGSARPVDPKEGIEESAVILRGAAARWFLRWKQRPQSLPLPVGKVSSTHNSEPTLFENTT